MQSLSGEKPLTDQLPQRHPHPQGIAGGDAHALPLGLVAGMAQFQGLGAAGQGQGAAQRGGVEVGAVEVNFRPGMHLQPEVADVLGKKPGNGFPLPRRQFYRLNMGRKVGMGEAQQVPSGRDRQFERALVCLDPALVEIQLRPGVEGHDERRCR